MSAGDEWAEMRRPGQRGPAPWPAIVFLLTRGPRTRKELRSLLGVKRDTATAVLRALASEGLVAEDGLRGKAKVFRWVPAGPQEMAP